MPRRLVARHSGVHGRGSWGCVRMSRLNHHNHHHIIVKSHHRPRRSAIKGHHGGPQNACPSIDGQPARGRGGAIKARALPTSACAVAGGSALARQRPPTPLHLFLAMLHVVAHPHRPIVVVRASVNGRW